MALIRTIFWTAIFLASTFAFTVVFEYGLTDYVQNAKKEVGVLKALFSAKPIERKKDGSDKVLPPLPGR